MHPIFGDVMMLVLCLKRIPLQQNCTCGKILRSDSRAVRMSHEYVIV